MGKLNRPEQERSQEFAKEYKRGSLRDGRKSPSGVQGQSSLGVWGRNPRSRRHAEFPATTGGTCTQVPLGYATA